MNVNDLEYHNNYIKYTRSELIERVSKSVNESRFNHILRVEKKAVELAEQYNGDVEKASIAALLHDYAKQRSDAEFVKYINKYELKPILLDYGNAIWHGVVGAEIIKSELNIYDEEILNAVRRHTIGAPVMTLLDQITFMADYIEDGRDFDGVKEAREVTSKSLQEGVLYQLEHTTSYLIENQKPIYPEMIDAYNAWVQRVKL